MKFPYLPFLFLVFPSLCFAELDAENLLQTMPAGYKVDFQTKKGNMVMTEMVPKAENVNNWTEMLTTQVFLGMKNATPVQFQARLGQLWLSSCKDSEVTAITKGEENGYSFSIWLQTCPLNQSTGKPENTWFKAIKGNDSFYLVQKAFKFSPSKEQITEWMQYFSSVMVCDSRITDRTCPKLERINR
jgi:hypothetical protein